MISVYQLKPAFQNLLRIPTRALFKAGITANQVTITAMLLSICVGACIYLYPKESWPLLLLGPFLLIRMALNAIDGMLAREHDMQSALGAFLNEIGDVVSDVALYLPLALVAGFRPELIILSVILLCLTEISGILATQVGTKRRFDGPMGKSDRALVFGIVSLLLGCGLNLNNWLTGIMITVNILLLFTVFNRVKNALNELKISETAESINNKN